MFRGTAEFFVELKTDIKTTVKLIFSNERNIWLVQKK